MLEIIPVESYAIADWIIVAGIAASFLSSVFSTLSSNRANRKNTEATNEANLQLTRENNEANREMWQLQNEYNKPENVLSRYVDAGLNPYTALDGSALGQAGAVPEMKAPRLDQMAPVEKFDALNNVISQYLDTQIRGEQQTSQALQNQKLKDEVSYSPLMAKLDYMLKNKELNVMSTKLAMDNLALQYNTFKEAKQLKGLDVRRGYQNLQIGEARLQHQLKVNSHFDAKMAADLDEIRARTAAIEDRNAEQKLRNDYLNKHKEKYGILGTYIGERRGIPLITNLVESILDATIEGSNRYKRFRRSLSNDKEQFIKESGGYRYLPPE
ncbi:DNA pilot protein [Tortoise microvirus 31]|nr:DNA pilot protein [Tortoise microvirus 31]